MGEPLRTAPIGAELLDDPGADPREVAASLRNIARANRWFGGAAAVRWALGRVLGNVAPGTALTLLDVGTGLGDLPRAAARWGAARGLRLSPLGLERNRTAAALAAAEGLPTVVGCAGALPLRDGSVDLVLVSQVAHHLAWESVVRLFRECDRVARRAVIVADLRRAGAAGVAYRWGALLLRFDPVTLADGLTSIRRGYTVEELRALLELAGVRGEVCGRPGFRLVAIWRPT
ncbi:MAG TPA: methyltransferase domain-containing protein [Gemmatimonadales bacterium]|nr:methyltransferase domain-containing protein [Gemmatimonadales bacterium]